VLSVLRRHKSIDNRKPPPYYGGGFVFGEKKNMSQHGIGGKNTQGNDLGTIYVYSTSENPQPPIGDYLDDGEYGGRMSRLHFKRIFALWFDNILQIWVLSRTKGVKDRDYWISLSDTLKPTNARFHRPIQKSRTMEWFTGLETHNP
jgi:hypothetical protein